MKNRGCEYLLVLLVAIAGEVSAEIVGVDFGPGSSPLNWNSVTKAGTHSNLLDESGAATSVDLTVTNAGTGFEISPAANTIPKHHSNLAGVDGNGYQFNGKFNAQLRNLNPNQPYNVYLFGLRGGAKLQQSVTFTGSSTVSYLQTAGDGQLAINDQVGNNNQNLSSYAKQVVASAAGTIDVSVVGGGTQGSPFVVAGLAFEEGTEATTQSPRQLNVPRPGLLAVADQSTARSVKPDIAATADIVGLRLDMTLDEAKSVLQESGIFEKMVEGEADIIQTWGSRLEGLKYRYLVRAIGDRIVNVFGSAPPNEGKISGIVSSHTLGRMFYADFKPLLVEKYGPPVYEYVAKTTSRGENGILSWSYGRDGRPLTEPRLVNACFKGNYGGPDKVMHDINMGSSVQERDFGYCGFTLVYSIAVLNQEPSVMHRYHAYLFDYNDITRRNEETVAYSIAEAEKIKAEELKAIGNAKKPVL